MEESIEKYIIMTEWIETYITQEHFIFCKNLESMGWKIIYLGQAHLSKLWKDIKSQTVKKCIILCVTYDVLDISVFKTKNTCIIYKIDDLYPFREYRRKSISGADIIISAYQYLFQKSDVETIYPGINHKSSYYVPFSAVDSFFSDISFNETPVCKIFVSGNSDEELYPLRYYIKTQDIFKTYIETLEHPSYFIEQKHDIKNKKYYETLNKYLCCFTDVSIYDYMVLKIFEICSVGSLLLVQESAQLKNLGFLDNINCILCNKLNVNDKIQWILDDSNRLQVDNIRRKGMELVRTQHTTMCRSIQVNNIVENVMKSYFLNSDENFLSRPLC